VLEVAGGKRSRACLLVWLTDRSGIPWKIGRRLLTGAGRSTIQLSRGHFEGKGKRRAAKHGGRCRRIKPPVRCDRGASIPLGAKTGTTADPRRGKDLLCSSTGFEAWHRRRACNSSHHVKRERRRRFTSDRSGASTVCGHSFLNDYGGISAGISMRCSERDLEADVSARDRIPRRGRKLFGGRAWVPIASRAFSRLNRGVCRRRMRKWLCDLLKTTSGRRSATRSGAGARTTRFTLTLPNKMSGIESGRANSWAKTKLSKRLLPLEHASSRPWLRKWAHTLFFFYVVALGGNRSFAAIQTGKILQKSTPSSYRSLKGDGGGEKVAFQLSFSFGFSSGR